MRKSFLNTCCALVVVVYTVVISKSDALASTCTTVVPIFFDSTNSWHRDIQYHPEQPLRIDACVKALRERLSHRVDLVDVAVAFSDLELNHARDMLIKAHSADLVTNLEQRCRDSRRRRIDEGRAPLGFVGYVDDDTYITTESFDVCLRATAAWIRAVDYAMIGKKDTKTSAALALTRPPGHHATTNLSNGFCLFNFAAAATIHALESDPNLKVSIFDWDVHFGQGVAEIVERYDRARYVSIHQTPAFPYMGATRKIQGEHANVLTLPIPPETTWTCGYQEKFKKEVLPFIRSQSWEPDLVIICAGYDALDSDELASVNLQARDYGEMTRQLLEYLSVGRPTTSIALGLEGGYQLKEMAGGGNLADAVVETVLALSSFGETRTTIDSQ